jgi:hypothetical protein
MSLNTSYQRSYNRLLFVALFDDERIEFVFRAEIQIWWLFLSGSISWISFIPSFHLANLNVDDLTSFKSITSSLGQLSLPSPQGWSQRLIRNPRVRRKLNTIVCHATLYYFIAVQDEVRAFYDQRLCPKMRVLYERNSMHYELNKGSISWCRLIFIIQWLNAAIVVRITHLVGCRQPPEPVLPCENGLNWPILCWRAVKHQSITRSHEAVVA